jgi:hypothetical protein
MVSINYQPTNPLRGQGTVGTAPFRYQASDEHLVRERQVETNPSSKTGLFLTQEIGVFFSDVLRLELGRSGYTIKEPSDRILSGTITRTGRHPLLTDQDGRADQILVELRDGMK